MIQLAESSLWWGGGWLGVVVLWGNQRSKARQDFNCEVELTGMRAIREANRTEFSPNQNTPQLKAIARG